MATQTRTKNSTNFKKIEGTTTTSLRRSARLNALENGGKTASNGNSNGTEIIKKVKPFVKYEGRIVYVTEFNEMAATADDIMQWIDQSIAASTDPKNAAIPLSFDMEWPFTFQTGSGKTSVVQIAVKEDCCYVFQLTKLVKLPAALLHLLKHPNVRLHGVNIKNDFRKLARDFPEVKAEDYLPNCVELSTWCNQVCETGGRWSLADLTEYLLHESVDKNRKVRMSKWNVMPLDEQQLMYAAIDVYIGLRIYKHLQSLATKKQANQEAFIAEHGLVAFKALKVLDERFLPFEDDEKEKKEEDNNITEETHTL